MGGKGDKIVEHNLVGGGYCKGITGGSGGMEDDEHDKEKSIISILSLSFYF